MSYLIALLFFVVISVLLYAAASEKPLFKMKCYICGEKDRNWRIVPIGHDDFAWQHHCED